ncbi:MAG: TldD/PmbA family protein [Candidatus Micrarchaeota archaeon]
MLNESKFSHFFSKYDYADIRVESSVSDSISFADEELKLVSGQSKGICVRVLVNDSWGFASSNNQKDFDDMGNLFNKAEKLAKIEKSNIRLTDIPITNKKVKKEYKYIEPEQKLKEIRDALNGVEGQYIKNKMLSYYDQVIKKEFYSSAGSLIHQEINYGYLSCSAIAKYNDKILKGSSRQASISGFSKIDCEKVCLEAKEKAERLINAVAPPKGRFVVIMDNEMTGVFSHEALGHASEADGVIDRESILVEKLNKKIGNENVNITDDPTANDFGYYAYDDEGVKAQKTPLVKNGVLVNYLNSLETSAKLKILQNGHARAMDYSSFPIVRMSNTYFQPGSDNIEDIFDVKHAIYVKGMKGGSVDTFSGGFMFKSEEAWEIVNGEKKNFLSDVTLSGNVLETLNNVELIGKDFGSSPGICGKFMQSVEVSDGGPHVRVKQLMVG